MKNKKGFTLIELLAVIVILAVIALIATPIILNMIESARKSAATDSAYGYIKAIEYETSLADLKGNKYEDKEDYTYNEIKVNIKGEAPTGGRYSLKNGVVTSGVFCINGYTVNYSDNTMTVGDKGCTGEDLKYEGKVVLSETQGDYTYPESRTFEVKENLSGGDLSCTTSDAEVATCSIEGNLVTVTPGTKEDSATITIISASTEKYKEAQAAYLVKTAKGLLTINAYDYTGTYDGEEHSITLEVEDATIKYGTEEGKYTLTENPKYVDADTYTVYYQIEKEGYNTITGSKTVTINKAEGSATLSSSSGTVYLGESNTFTVSNATGTLSCTSSNTSVATCSVNDKKITVSGVSAGSATITVNISESTNYNATTIIYLVTVKQQFSNVVKIGDYVKMTPTSTSYTTDTTKTGYTSSQTINPSELNLWRVIRVNNDGTIEMVSENISSTQITLGGQTGYKNLVGYLNVLANQYQNKKYTIKARHMGYNGQTEYLTDTANTVDSTSTTPPWTCSTVQDGCNTIESQGGGDMLYTTDTNLVETALGTLVANDPSGEKKYYWLATRQYNGGSIQKWYYYGRCVLTSGSISPFYGTFYHYSNGFTTGTSNYCLRPIVTLKSSLETPTGSGTSSDPYVLP